MLRGRVKCVALCLWPTLIPIALAAVYFISPRFYLRYILEHGQRENQFVEIATVICAFTASFMLVVAGVRAWRNGTADRLSGLAPSKRLLDGRGGAAIIFFLAAGCFFFAGEEISWGQTYLGWESEMRETNLHNTVPISFSGLGSVVIVLILIGIPILWRMRDRVPVPRDWEPAVAEWSVVCCVMIAFSVSWVKDIAHSVVADPETHKVYRQYFDELNEQKELVMAVAFLMYAVYRLRKTKRSAEAASSD